MVFPWFLRYGFPCFLRYGFSMLPEVWFLTRFLRYGFFTLPEVWFFPNFLRYGFSMLPEVRPAYLEVRPVYLEVCRAYLREVGTFPKPCLRKQGNLKPYLRKGGKFGGRA